MTQTHTIDNTDKDKEYIDFAKTILEWINDGSFDDYESLLTSIAASATARLANGGAPLRNVSIQPKRGLIDPHDDQLIQDDFPPQRQMYGQRRRAPLVGTGNFTRYDLHVGQEVVLVSSRGNRAWWSGCTMRIEKLNPAKAQGIIVAQPSVSNRDRTGGQMSAPYALNASVVK